MVALLVGLACLAWAVCQFASKDRLGLACTFQVQLPCACSDSPAQRPAAENLQMNPRLCVLSSYCLVLQPQPTTPTSVALAAKIGRAALNNAQRRQRRSTTPDNSDNSSDTPHARLIKPKSEQRLVCPLYPIAPIARRHPHRRPRPPFFF